mmetsp:Transcript_29795/g.41158  ORF Transcript_29795/g.41158 Transcript_29795/m.41158 type:complete len:168 (-) Transcript_29795:265-768(-)|eukprot:CAMPEP_0196591062 /NCGR_PEP_ID=MMETSP1081-20130531/68410_1 /TAXON_ID=36882 /ORGANISM="Pyramimonas amylifera, Strain CCMP720" /LENGTH=167 /DNA_ID=CAMNT_0041914319 /DNA_START=75 /DNA_END=578 /DNA_ORIENTATION=+
MALSQNSLILPVTNVVIGLTHRSKQVSSRLCAPSVSTSSSSVKSSFAQRSVKTSARRARKTRKSSGFQNLVKEEVAEAEVAEEIPQGPGGPADFWEGEQWETFGNVARFGAVITAVLAVLVGVFASKTYNDGAVPVDFNAAASPSEAVRIALETVTPAPGIVMSPME